MALPVPAGSPVHAVSFLTQPFPLSLYLSLSTIERERERESNEDSRRRRNTPSLRCPSSSLVAPSLDERVVGSESKGKREKEEQTFLAESREGEKECALLLTLVCKGKSVRSVAACMVTRKVWARFFGGQDADDISHFFSKGVDKEGSAHHACVAGSSGVSARGVE